MAIPRHTEGTTAKVAKAAKTAKPNAIVSKPLEQRLRLVDGSASHENCKPVADILVRIGDKWSVLVVMLLGDGPRRFNEMRRMIGGISQRMLTLTLRGLERDGFVTRTVFATVPPRVDYDLTDLGRSLREPISRLGEWAFAHREQVEHARRKFDAVLGQPAGVVHRMGSARR